MARSRDMQTGKSPRALTLGTTVLLAGGALVALVAGPTPAGATQTSPMPASGTVAVQAKGNGHGHGMSQWGAQGAALKGLSSTQILAFYYPGTRLVTLPASYVRVQLSNAGTYTTIGSGPTGLKVTGVTGSLPTAGMSRYRLVPTGSVLELQQLALKTGAKWTNFKRLGATATFSSPKDYIRAYFPDKTSTAYRGTLSGVRSGSAQLTINRATLDQYAEGVTPRESPASWKPAAVHAQAIAARTYGRNAVENHRSAAFDICDTTQCQVYGGMRHYNSAGQIVWVDDPDAIASNNNRVLQSNHVTIFAQFSASNGGWTADGGQSYLVAKADPYDSAASGDPSYQFSSPTPVSRLASYYGLARVTAVSITSRDGHGAWGGRVLAGYVDGVDSHGTAHRITTTGFGLQAALGLGTTWITFG